MIRVVRCGPGDAALVLAAGELFDEPPTGEFTERFLRSGGHHLLLALDGDDPVGFVTGVEIAHPDKRVEMNVYELGVHDDRRREGIATRLLAELSELASELGCRGLWVLTEPDNEAALATYRRAGYTLGDPTVLLERSLPRSGQGTAPPAVPFPDQNGD